MRSVSIGLKPVVLKVKVPRWLNTTTGEEFEQESEWVRRSALCDILKTNFSALNEDRLYRNMDELYPKR
ncbi:MAG: hypothetical protein WA376_04840, partial [Terrimicrobiaceae bacterium]